MIAFFVLEIGFAKLWLLSVDVNGWPFFFVAYPAACIIFVACVVSLHIYTMRRFLSYRTQRRGRAVALRNFLRPTDDEPSLLRRVLLASYGITSDELTRAPSIWRAGGVA